MFNKDEKIKKLKAEIKNLKLVNKEHQKENAKLYRHIIKQEQLINYLKYNKMIEENKNHIPEIAPNAIEEYIRINATKKW